MGYPHPRKGVSGCWMVIVVGYLDSHSRGGCLGCSGYNPGDTQAQAHVAANHPVSGGGVCVCAGALLTMCTR